MAKTKNKKKLSISDKVRSKKSNEPVKTNPFEVKINRQKHDVLGKKVAKHDRGRPGVSRFKANQKRKETLLVEYKKRGKSNKFVDRRFAETNPEMSLEDKMLQRFSRERQKGHDKSGLFQLNEKDELTHYGQSLSQIEKFDEPVISDDEEDAGRLGADLVGEEHFGGFLRKKKVPDDATQGQTWKERMEDVIAKSKKQKYERQNEKEKSVVLTEELDKEWKSLMHVVNTSKRNKETIDSTQKKSDDYDIMVRQLQFEIKGTGSDRLKTEEEVAKEEKERLEGLERDRLRRMKGLTEESEQEDKAKYRSADDLDDGFDFSNKKVQFEVAYKDGEMIRKKKNKEADEESEDENEAQGDDDDESNDESGDESAEASGDELGDEPGVDSDDDADDAMDHLSDLESSDEEVTDDDQKPEQTAESRPVAFLKSSLKKLKVSSEESQDSLKKKEQMEKARKELPYMFQAPESYADLLGLLQDHSEQDQLLLIDRLQKLYHPSLAEGNKDKLQTMYTLLVEYYCDLALQDPPLLSLIDSLVRPLYQLTQRFPLHAGQTWSNLIASRQQELSQSCAKKGGRGVYPGLDVLLALKLIPLLYPTSDFKHRVVTPAMLFISQILGQCPVLSPYDVALGLLLSSILLQYVSFAKRYVPEVINFLRGLLFTAVKKEPTKIESVCPPFKPVGKNIDLLKLESKCKNAKIEPLKISQVFSSQGISYLESEDFKVVCIYQCLTLLTAYLKLYQHLAAWHEIFTPVIYFVKKLPLKRYPDEIKVLHDEILAIFESAETSRKPLTLQKDRPKPLKLFEPKFDDAFDGKRKRVGSKDTREKQRLVHKYKQEMKGAVRQLRQDNMFLAREKLNEQISKDRERKRKVNELLQDLASQEGDFQAMKRAKENM